MNKDRIASATKQAEGGLKDATGRIIRDSRLVADGIAERTEGKMQNAICGLADTIKTDLASKTKT